MDTLKNISTRITPQTEPARPDQVKNSAGGHTFTITPEQRLRRFLTLGVDGGTYYVGQHSLAKDNAKIVLDTAENNPELLLSTILDVSLAGKAPRHQPTLFALAVAASHGDADARRAALAALPQVARTGTHLFMFAEYVQQFRGWGRSLRRAVSSWYTSKNIDALSYQLIKYRQRDGWSHRDLLRLSHNAGYRADPVRQQLYNWAVGRHADTDGIPLLEGFIKASRVPVKQIPALIREYGLTWEMLPTEALTDRSVWEALLVRGMPQTALLRQLPRLTSLGVLSGEHGRRVAEQLADGERLRRARVHPMSVLTAATTYASGVSPRGKSTWIPERRIVDALDAAFYASFSAIEPSGKRLLLALDVSTSMTQPVAGLPITARDASAAIALITAATEPNYDMVGFTGGSHRRHFGACRHTDPSSALSSLTISPRQRLDDVVDTIDELPFGATDCALPMLYALKKGMKVDTFVIYTDSETYAGDIHPHQALKRYREQINPDAKLVVVGMTATDFSIADPRDPGMLDVAGFDTSVPNLISDFAQGL